MNRCHLVLGQTECLPVDQSLDGGHLVQEDKVAVKDVEVNCIQERFENLVIEWIETSLYKLEVHDAAKNFEKVLANIIRSTRCLSDNHLELFFLIDYEITCNSLKWCNSPFSLVVSISLWMAQEEHV